MLKAFAQMLAQVQRDACRVRGQSQEHDPTTSFLDGEPPEGRDSNLCITDRLQGDRQDNSDSRRT
jgi:hypothetical protein